jgi:uncharacterized membrane protein YvlD (DUF360 family)
MQRLFSMFPPGLPGFALLILRTSVALTVVFHGFAHREELAAWVLACFLLLVMALIAGFLTPILALLALAVQFIGPWPAISTSGLFVVSILNAVALALLGPGAYSFDAARFGRRVVDLPPNSDE